MKELELSVMYHNNRAIEQLQTLLEKFEQQKKVRIRIKTLTWNEAWAELVKVALYRNGPDVSEIGNTWISDFVRMTALYPFSPIDVKVIGGAETFLPALWKSSLVYKQPQIWAIPWLADTRILFYRKDILSTAGIKEEGAFASFEAMEETLQKLKDQGTKTPWVIPTGRTHMSLHHIASWIWGAGGHFLSEDGSELLISQPEALEGIGRYFNLLRFLTPEACNKNDVESDSLYWSGEAAVTLSGTWLMSEENIPQQVHVSTGYVSPPGVPFVGGSHLAIWQHCHQRRDALALIHYLTSPEVQTAYSKAIGLLPANQDVLSSPSYSNDPRYQRLVERLKEGRSFRSAPLWGMVENRLSSAFSRLWNDLLQDPEADVDTMVEQHMVSLSRRINLALQEN